MKMINLNQNGSYKPLVYNGLYGALAPSRQALFSPAVDIFEEEKSYFIQLAVPGLTKESFRIDLEKDLLSISGERKAEAARKYHLQESRSGSFSRSFVLPEDVDMDKIEASYEQGLLTLKLPKLEHQAKKIKIKVK